jgi:hypothetical protein
MTDKWAARGRWHGHDKADSRRNGRQKEQKEKQ